MDDSRIAKFRPLLSEKDIDFLIAAIDNMPSSVQGEAVRRKLAKFMRKVEAGLVSVSSYVGRYAGSAENADLEMGITEAEKAAWMDAELARQLAAIAAKKGGS